MKFDYIIMNPPYGKHHLPILRQLIDNHVSEGSELVTIQPIRWFVDPVWDRKQGSDGKKMEPYVTKHLESLEIISGSDAHILFDKAARFQMDLGIMNFRKNPSKTFDAHKFIYTDNILDYICEKKENSVKTHIKTYEKNKPINDRFVVPIRQICARNGKLEMTKKPISCLYSTIDVIVDGFVKDRPWYDVMNTNKQNNENRKFEGLAFQTEQEAINCANSMKTTFYRWHNSRLRRDAHIHLSWLPYMHDYNTEWTNERFFEFFKIDEETRKEILSYE